MVYSLEDCIHATKSESVPVAVAQKATARYAQWDDRGPACKHRVRSATARIITTRISWWTRIRLLIPSRVADAFQDALVAPLLRCCWSRRIQCVTLRASVLHTQRL